MTGSAALVWIWLNDIADSNGEVTISLLVLGYGTGLTQHTVIRALRCLVAEGIVERLGQDRHNTPCRYRLVRPSPPLFKKRVA